MVGSTSLDRDLEKYLFASGPRPEDREKQTSIESQPPTDQESGDPVNKNVQRSTHSKCLLEAKRFVEKRALECR